MKITVINKRSSAGGNVYCIDGTEVAPGAQHEMSGRTAGELVFQSEQVTDDDVSVIGQIEGSDRAPIVCVMNVVADPAGDAAESLGEGFALKTEAGGDANVAPQMYMGVFDDADCQTPAVNATLDTATAGTINSGDATNLIKCTPTAAGAFACSVLDAEDEKVYMKAWPVGTDYVVDSSDTSDVTFTAA
jgi:hypothetical protein